MMMRNGGAVYPGYRREYFKWRIPYASAANLWTYTAPPDKDPVSPSKEELEEAKLKFFIAAAKRALQDGFVIEEIHRLEVNYYADSMYGANSIDVSAEILMIKFEPPKQKDRNRTW